MKTQSTILNRDNLVKIKMYLEAISDINYVAKDDLVKEWNEVYGIVYEELNGVKLSNRPSQR